jgi:hypothetical protein
MDGTWLNEPPEWIDSFGRLAFTTAPDTDFWNRTHYGYRRHNGHFFGIGVAKDFSAEAVFSAEYEALYDQAGLMLRVDENTWLKTGIEYTDDAPHFSVVVTRGDQSDWSVMPMPSGAMAETSVRLTRHGDAVRVQYRLADTDWALARLAYLPMPTEVLVGPMACSPKGSGMKVEFARFDLGPPISQDLHS